MLVVSLLKRASVSMRKEADKLGTVVCASRVGHFTESRNAAAVQKRLVLVLVYMVGGKKREKETRMRNILNSRIMMINAIHKTAKWVSNPTFPMERNSSIWEELTG